MGDLLLKRFCRLETYPILRAEWYLLSRDGTDEDPDTLWLEMNFGRGNSLSEDTEFLQAEPNWEVSFSARSLNKEDLVVGTKMKNENAEEDSEALFYYCEHQPTIGNQMEILKTEGDSLLIKLTAKTMDVNYYDGSKPLNELQLTTWFQHKK